LIETRTAQKRATEDELGNECETVLATIDDLIAEGKPAKALDALNAAVEKAGDFRAARVLRTRLEKLQ
jgi:hypothetical protein